MDKTILIEYADVRQEINDLRRRIGKLEDDISKLENSIVSDSVSCGKRGKKSIRTVKVSGIPTAQITRKKMVLSARKAMMKEKEQELLERQNEVEEFIQGIEKSELRTMLRLYYIDGLTWDAVSIRMNRMFPDRKIDYTKDSCRKKHDRFFEKN